MVLFGGYWLPAAVVIIAPSAERSRYLLTRDCPTFTQYVITTQRYMRVLYIVGDTCRNMSPAR